MKNILTIMKKELKRVFTDRRMLLSLFLPGLLNFIIYSLIGNITSSLSQTDDDFIYNIAVFNDNDDYDLENIVQGYVVKITNYDYDKLLEKKDELHDTPKKTSLIIEFSENFNKNNVNSYINIFYNSTSNESSTIYQAYFLYLYSDSKDITIVDKFKVNENEDVRYDLASDEDSSKQFIAMLLPYLLIILLFTGCMSITADSIAGEKERGTLGALLITPIKRSEFALGKIFSLVIISLVSSLASFIGLFASLQNMADGALNLNTSMYGVKEYLGILAIIIVTVLLFVCILSIISSIAKSVKEASSYSGPIMIIVTLIGLTSLLGMGEATSNTILYLIPVYNSIQCMNAILYLQFNLLNFLVTIVSNLLIFFFGVFVIVKLFNSEKIMASS